MDAGGRVGGHDLLTLGYHRQDAAVHRGAACIDGQALCQEDLREMLCDAPPYAVVLTLSHGGQVAQPLVGGLVELLQQSQGLLSLACQFVLLTGLAQRPQHPLVVVLADEPPRAVAAVVGEIEGHIALRSRCVVEVGQLTVVIHVVGTREPGVGLDVVACGLCRQRHRDGQHQDRDHAFHILQIFLGILDIVGGIVGLSGTCWLEILCGHPTPDLMRRYLGVLKDECPGSDNRPLSYLAAVEERGPHADECSVVYGAGMHGDVVPYGDIAADVRGACVVCHVYARAVLYVGAVANGDGCDVAPDDGIKPHRALVAHLHIAHDGGVLAEIAVLTPLWREPLIRFYQSHFLILNS